jgi:hypothetical protein
LQHLLNVIRMAELVRHPHPAIANHIAISKGRAKEAAERVFAKLWQVQKKLKGVRTGRVTQLAGTIQCS